MDLDNLLIKYIKKNSYYDYVKIDYYNVDGAICIVWFFTDEGRHNREQLNINIWSMISFLNKK